MKRFKLAYENEAIVDTEEVVQPQTEEQLEQGISELESADEQVEAGVEEVSEVTDIQETVGEIGESVAEDIEASGEISPETAKVVEIATEHFAKRLGVKGKALPSLEGFKDSTDKAADSKKALKSLVALEAAIEDGLVLAEEGLIDDIKGALSVLGQTEDNALATLDHIKNKGDFSDRKEFSNATWSNYIPSEGQELDGAAVIAILEKTLKASRSAEVSKMAADLITSLTKLTKEVRNNWFTSNKYDIERIQEIGQKANEVAAALKEELGTASGKKTSKSFVSPDKKQADKIVSLVKELIQENSLENITDTLGKKSTGLKLWSWWQNTFRLKSGVVGMLPGGGVAQAMNSAGDEVTWLDSLQPEDMREAKKAAQKARSALNDLRAISTNRLKMVSAINSYLVASAK